MDMSNHSSRCIVCTVEINNDEGGDQLINLLKDKFVASSEVNLDKLKEQATKQFANMQLDQPVTDSALQKVAMEGTYQLMQILPILLPILLPSFNDLI